MHAAERTIANSLTPGELRSLVVAYEVESDEHLDSLTSSELTVRDPCAHGLRDVDAGHRPS